MIHIEAAKHFVCDSFFENLKIVIPDYREKVHKVSSTARQIL